MRKIRTGITKAMFYPQVSVRLLITLLYTASGLFTNFFVLQVFCMPVLYAAVWWILAFAAVAFFPFTTKKSLRKMAFFIMGAGIPVQLYCIVFLADPWSGFTGYAFFTVAVLFFGIGLPAFIPFYFLYHTYRYCKEARPQERKIFILGVIVPMLTLLVFSVRFYYRYETIYHLFARSNCFDNRIADAAQPDYFTERILGIGFLYHTKLEFIYDGPRPPLHDPFINTCLWFNRKNRARPEMSFYGLPMDLGVRQQYYHTIFPSRPLRFKCPCAFTKNGRTPID